MPKQIEIEFFRYLQKIGETLAHLLSIKQSKFQLHKIKLHAIVIVKWLIPMEIRLENGFLTLSPFFFQGNGSKLVRNLVLGSYWYILGVQLMILIGDLISVRANEIVREICSRRFVLFAAVFLPSPPKSPHVDADTRFIVSAFWASETWRRGSEAYAGVRLAAA